MSVHSSASSIGSIARLKKSRSSQMKAINEDMLNKTSVNWTDLGEKIDDWFSCAKTPGKIPNSINSSFLFKKKLIYKNRFFSLFLLFNNLKTREWFINF